MASEPTEGWASDRFGGTLIGRRAARPAARKTHGLRTVHPIRTRFARLLSVHTDERSSKRGADGELVAGWWLGRLPDGWHVLHDVAAGDTGANADHLVVGPAGVFTINTKKLTGKVWLGSKSILHNRRRTDFLRKASDEACRASKLLSAAVGRPVEVRGVLAILADDWTIKERPADVYVDATRGVKDWMLRQPAVLRPQEVIELAAAASKPATWIETPAPAVVIEPRR